MLETQQIILLATFVAMTVCVYVLLTGWNPGWLLVRSRLKNLQDSGEQAAYAASDLSKISLDDPADAGVFSAIGNRVLLRQRLRKAGIYHSSAASWFTTTQLALATAPMLIAVGLGLYGQMAMEMALLAGCVSGLLGWVTPSVWLDRAVNRRQVQFRSSLPDFLDLMIVCLDGGMSLQESIRRVSDELRLVHPSLAFELSLVQRDTELGATVDQALKKLASRTDHDGVRTMSTFIREAQRFGTNITDALRNHAEFQRSQREQIAEEKAQKASVKILMPTLLLIMPAIFVVLLAPAAIQIHEAFSTQ